MVERGNGVCDLLPVKYCLNQKTKMKDTTPTANPVEMLDRS